MFSVIYKDTDNKNYVGAATDLYEGEYTKKDSFGGDKDVNGIWIELASDPDDRLFLEVTTGTLTILEKAFNDGKIDLRLYGSCEWESILDEENKDEDEK